MTFWKARLILFLREGKHSETKVAIAQALGRSCCGQSGSGMLEFGFKLDFLLYTHTLPAYHMYTIIPCFSLGLCPNTHRTGGEICENINCPPP